MNIETENRQLHFETKLIHAGEPEPVNGAVTLPIFQSSTFEYSGASDYNDLRYIRLNNTPNHLGLGAKLAALEGAEAAVVTASGMAAITTGLLALVEQGGHLLALDCVYGGTFHFLKENFPNLGREVSFFRSETSSDLSRYLKPNTKAIYVEPLSNPLLKIPDLKAIVSFAKAHGILTFIDNTFLSPVNFNPIAMGFDVVFHSATKYLNGHTDIVAGAVIGKRETVSQVTRLLNHLGGSLDPHACFLLNRGLKTLAVRMSWQNDSAIQLAQALSKHPRVAKVIHPSLASHPDQGRAKEYFRGFGGMLAFEIHGTALETESLIQNLQIPFSAPSLGGVESLVTRPVKTSHAGVSPEDREAIGIRDTLIRVSVGLEHPNDLIADFQQALDRA